MLLTLLQLLRLHCYLHKVLHAAASILESKPTEGEALIAAGFKGLAAVHGNKPWAQQLVGDMWQQQPGCC